MPNALVALGNATSLQFEAISHLPAEEQGVVKEVLERLIIKYQTHRWNVSRATAGIDTARA